MAGTFLGCVLSVIGISLFVAAVVSGVLAAGALSGECSLFHGSSPPIAPLLAAALLLCDVDCSHLVHRCCPEHTPAIASPSLQAAFENVCPVFPSVAALVEWNTYFKQLCFLVL